MALEMRLSLRQAQRMIMTQSLQQAIGLLQLNRLELIQVIHQQMEENPILEEEMSEVGDESSTAAADEEKPEEKPAEDRLSEFDWESYFAESADFRREFPREEVEHWSPEERMTRPRTLADHLQFQLHLSVSDPALTHWAHVIIGSLDENGYLPFSLEELPEAAPKDAPVIAEALQIVQGFDPTGVAARDLRECLLLQLAAFGDEASLARTIIEEHLADLEGHHLQRIADKLKVPVQAIQEAIMLICSLEPKPGRTYSSEEPRYITPDVYLLKVDDRFIVVLNEDGLPRLKVSAYYRQLVGAGRSASKETREYVEGKMRSALWLIRSIEQRQRTLYRVTESIAKFQCEFLEQGISAMRPLTLKEVAEDIEMHESTISRVTTNKYVHTPQGLFELKYFFHRGVQASDGESVSSLTVKDLVRKLLTAEDSGKPLSDQKIVEVLRRQGIEIARRTVAKYRSQLKIPSSSKRRRF